ncbi:hypothetical protein NP233_g1736 [Leucocoprinus birnbaumii]|uniref:Uncharacterized protein n=1 Tax=Leucocoprinus birnbaumii TaxID=56174 RepID=A0AAD5VZI0_9AGAR|nr:hypothetical protein NP233_g1736 [Leucocoprinus birnbaumii]
MKPSDGAWKFDAKENNWHVPVIRKTKFCIIPITNASGRELSILELRLQFNKTIAAAGETPDATPLVRLQAIIEIYGQKREKHLLLLRQIGSIEED